MTLLRYQQPGEDIFEAYTNATVREKINATVDLEGEPSGHAQRSLRGKVFEESGNFSVDSFSLIYPYSSFTGIRCHQGDKARGMLLTDKPTGST